MKLSRDDRSYLVLENERAPMQVCALATLDRAPALDALRSTLAARLPPIMKQRLDGHSWVDDPDFDIRAHVIAAPARRLEPMIGELLDRSRPLWQIVLLTGGERPALLIKIHHAIADGLAALELMARLFSAELPPPAAGVRREPPPTASFGQWPSLSPRTSLNHPVRAGRRVCWTRLDLAEVRKRAHAAAGHVNDVVLDVVCEALRPLLAARGELVPGLMLRATVPVSLRTERDAASGGNVVGGMLVDLPVGEADPQRRLAAIVESTRRAKATQSAAMLPRVIGRIARFSQWIFAHQRWVNVFVTNVPGPAVPLQLLGARIVDLVPLSSPAGNVTVTFAALSYAGALYVSATADSSCEDFDVLARGLTGPPSSVGAPGRPRAPQARA
jgi:hypothetical protein